MKILNNVWHFVMGRLTGTLRRHFKGGLYREIRRSVNVSNGCMEPMVIYYSFSRNELLIRFDSYVEWPDGVSRCRFASGLMFLNDSCLSEIVRMLGAKPHP